MKELTKAEEQIMQILWKLKAGFVKDIRDQLPEPKPAYNTVSTIVRILEKKGFVSYIAYGKTHQYYPIIKKDVYKKQSLKRLVKNYFGNSYGEMVSFFTKDENLSASELEEIVKIIHKELIQQKAKEK
jgi:predicted transcriptional regulator